MDRVYRPRIQADTMRNMARSMVKFRGRKMTKTSFNKYLDKDKDLKRMTRLTGTMSQHEAQKFLKTFAKKVGDQEHMDFSMFAKKHNIHTSKHSGEMSDLAAKRAYQLSAKEEIAGETPKGPTKIELQALRREEKRRKFRNLANRKLSDMRDEKKTNRQASVFSKGKEKEESKAVVSASSPQQNQKKSDSDSEKKSNIRMPTMESLGGIPQQQRSQRENPIIQNPVIPDDEKNGSAGPFPEDPNRTQDESSEPLEHDQNDELEVDVDEELPL